MTNFLKHKLRAKTPGEIIGAIICGGILVTGLGALFGYLIMRLWNWLMPMIFELPTLSFWEAVGLFVLSKILLGGIGGGCGKNKKTSGNCSIDKKREFSKWKHYKEFWEEEGEAFYDEYLEKKCETPKDTEK